MESVSCPLCTQKQESYLWSKKDAVYVECRNCHLVYENPRLSDEELKQFYSNEDYYISRPDDKDRKGYLNYYSQCTPVIAYEYFRILKKYVKAETGIRFLDIGCGPGNVLQIAKDSGWDCTGLELSHWAAEIAKKNKLNVIEGTLNDAHFPEDHFDVISMFDVLEHLPYPVDYVEHIYKILKPGGVVIVETPNIFGFFARHIYKQRSELVKPRAHICLYSTQTASRLFQTVPFLNVKVETFPYCRKYTMGYIKSVIVSRMKKKADPMQLTWNESLRIIARK